MADFDLERNGQPGTPEGSNTAVRWGLLLSVALHAGAVALLVTGAEPPVYHAPASPIDVTFIEPGPASAPAPEPSEAPASASAAALPAQDDDRVAETPPQSADGPTADTPPPPPTSQPAPDAAEPARQPVAAPPPPAPAPAPAHRPPPTKPAEAKPAHAARPSPPPLPSDSAAASPLDSLPNAYAGLIKTRIALAMIYPEKPGRDRRQALVVVRFHIMADGSVTNLAVVRSSGRDILDRAAEDTIRHSTPFPPIPATVGSRWIDMTVTMKY
ncbi:energy transducer TonB [Azospirillum sp. YIM B02556]|uniref:Energy transducer TonB n=1 Tax=Azospirillum endophyticum TaxID=2800326 RepID=A0ABS1F7L0_9PROT|nr:energy transducer TonB [Azospirillum endophyticum]MBK1839409.1 energy transducer TonB [Azospirillum endophyticum]